MHQQTNSTRKRKKLTLWLDEKTILALQTIRAQTSISMSSLVRQALYNYFSQTEIKNVAEKLQFINENLLVEFENFKNHRLPEMRAEVRELAYQVKQLNFRLDKLTEALEVVAFWGALISELIKVRLFNTKSLSQEEYERFKKLWYLAHERADARIESLMGKRVWKQKFDPEKDPLK